MQQSDLSTLSTPHLMCLLMCLHWHCPVACGDIRQCRTCCCRGQGNNGWLLLSCHLLSANALYSIYNLHNSINTTSHHTSLGGPVCAGPVYHLHHYIAVIIMAMSYVMCSVVIMAKVWFIIIHGTGADCGEVMFCLAWQQESSVTCAVMRARWCHVIVTS